MHKTNTCVTLPLHPDLADMLRAYRETVPHAPDEKVFPIAATRAAFRKDAERCGIRTLDDRGRAFSPHSCRKWHKSELVRAGVQQDIIDGLMRHAPRVGDRYLDTGMGPYVEALAKLPELWPGAWDSKSEKINPPRLDFPHEDADTYGADGNDKAHPPISDSALRGSASGFVASATDKSSVAESRKPESDKGIGSREQVESTVGCAPPLSVCGLNLAAGFDKGTAKAKALADLLRAVADLIS